MVNYIFAALFFVGFLFFLFNGLRDSGFKVTKFFTPFLEMSRDGSVVPKSNTGNGSVGYSVNDKHRRLEALETGKDVSELPDGIFGFADPLFLKIFINYPNEGLTLSSRNYNKFEIQKTNGEAFVIGFISNEAYSKSGEASDNSSIDLILFPKSWEDADRLVAIPFTSMKSVSHRSIDVDQGTMSILEFKTTKVVLLGIVSHVES